MPESKEKPDASPLIQSTSSAPTYSWEQCYEIGDDLHWALVDDEHDKTGQVACAYMVLHASYPNACDGKPVCEQFLPALIVKLLNEHFASQNSKH